MKKTLLIALHDMGVAAAIIDAFPRLSEKYNLHVFAKDGFAYASLKSKYRDSELRKFNTLGYHKITVGDARIILRYIRPDIVITGISNIYREYEGQDGIIHKGDFSFCEAANKAQIPTIGILEAVSMSNDLIKARFNKSRSLPKELVVQNADMKKKITQFGFIKEKNITVSLMPKYAGFSRIANEDKEEIRKKLLKINNLDENAFVVFYSTSAVPMEDLAAVEYLAKEIKARKDVKLLFGMHPKDRINLDFVNKIEKTVPGFIVGDYGGYDSISAVSALTSGNKGFYAGVKTTMLIDVALTKANLVNINLKHNKEYSKMFSGLSREVNGDKKGEISNIIDEIKTEGTIFNLETIKQYDNLNAVEDFCDCIDYIIDNKFNQIL